MITYKLEDVGRDVDNLKQAVSDIQKSDREQTKLLNQMNTSIAVIENNINHMSKTFENIGKTLTWGGAALGLLISIAVILNAVMS